MPDVKKRAKVRKKTLNEYRRKMGFLPQSFIAKKIMALRKIMVNTKIAGWLEYWSMWN